MLTIYSYPTCGTCRKAKKWLDANELEYEDVHIVDHPPSKAELSKFYEQSGLALKKFFNTSGRRYRDLGMKNKLTKASDEELLDWLASDGMLIKRPIVTDGKQVTVGFNETVFNQTWTN